MYTVLIVDSDKNHLNSLKSIIHDRPMKDLSFMFVESADQAMEKFEVEKIDVLISELKTPVMNGEELFDYIRMISPDTVKIAMTQVNDGKETLKILNKIEAFRIILKPVKILDDITIPIKYAIEYIEAQKKDTDDAEVLIQDNKDYKGNFDKIYKELNNGQINLKTQMSIAVGVSKTALQMEQKKQLHFDSAKIVRYYNETMRNYLKYLMFEVHDMKIMETSILNEFNDPNTGNTISLRNKLTGNTEESIIRRAFFITAILGNFVDYMLFRYHIIVSFECTEDEGYVLKFFCDLKNSYLEEDKLALKEEDKNTQKAIFELTKDMLVQNSKKAALGTKGNPFVAKVIM